MENLVAILEWFDTREAEQFARAVADDVTGRLPLPGDGRQNKITTVRLRNAHDAIMARAAAFGRTHKLNWYKKARLGNTFRWELLESGYDKAFVETWTQALLLAINRKSDAKD